MESSDIVRALRDVPEARLRLIDMAWEVFRDDGSLDQERIAYQGKELAEAIDEARAYAQATKEEVQCLRQMARSSS